MSNINPEKYTDPLGALLRYSSQDQPTIILNEGTLLSEEDLQEDADHLFLNSIFNGNHKVEDLPKGHFYLHQEDLDEESAEVSIPEFLQHYHTVADHLERGLCTNASATSPAAWIWLHQDLLAQMINGLHQTKSEGVDGSLTNLLINEELESIQRVGDHTRTVATAFSQFSLNNHQCNMCLHHVGKPIFSEADFTAFLHTTDHSHKTLYDSLWKHTQDRVNSEIQQAYATEIKSQQARIEEELQDPRKSRVRLGTDFGQFGS